ncbi:hypothetical protein EIK56_13810 [Sphingomonas sp. C8-2]|jgi:hypothetical protein|nr:hypothetical protein EIK56_13810 [Sphingomonas sp. C8-2]
MSLSSKEPVLFVGYGPVGSEAARSFRRLYPDLPFVIAGRRLEKAQQLAAEVGHAEAMTADIMTPGLGLPKGMRFSCFIPMIKDRALHGMTLAEEQHIPYAAFSEYVYDFAPFIARHIHNPKGAPLLLLGHLHGGSMPVAALELARGFRSIDKLTVSAIFDPVDFGGGGSASSNMVTGNFGVPSYLVRRDGKWQWRRNGSETLSITSSDGRALPAHGFALPDVITLANETGARSVDMAFALDKTARSFRGEGISHEIFVEIEGERHDGVHARERYELEDEAGYAAMSARGAVLCMERMMGLAGGPPVGPGLYNPETLLDPAHVVKRMQQFGTKIRKL